MKHFCVMPWYSLEYNLETNTKTPCCWLSTSIDRKELQQEFLDNDKPSICKKCWDAEDNGYESRRQMENRFLDYALDLDIENIEKQVLASTIKPNLYQINVGKLCNGTCTTCNEHCSSAWAALNNTKYKISDINVKVKSNFDVFSETASWENVKRINLLGGEPLLIQHTMDILEQLVNVNPDCLISIVTNGSVNLTQNQLDLFKQFTNISVCVSIDGTGKQFEYLRYPIKWDDVVENIAVYKEVFHEVTASFTVSNLNHFNKDETIRWFKDNDILYIENPVVDPPWFRPTVQPGGLLWKRFVEEITKQDLLKQIDITDYIPYISKLIKDNPIA